MAGKAIATIKPRRRAKSSITRLPDEQREYVEKLLRDGRMTLREMIADLQARFPGEPAADISQSALHRYDQRIEALGRDVREIEAASRAFVGGLGEGFGENSAELLTQAVTMIGLRAAMKAKDADGTLPKEVNELASVAVKINDSRRMSLARKHCIEAAAREAALREQREKLEHLGRTGAVDPAAVALVIKAAYDL